MAYVVMTYVVMAYVVMAYVVMAYIVMACVVMACTVLAGPVVDDEPSQRHLGQIPGVRLYIHTHAHTNVRAHVYTNDCQISTHTTDRISYSILFMAY